MSSTTAYAHQFRHLFHLFADAGYSLYLVGGCVRDMLMGKTPKDFDFTTNALPDQTRQVLRAAKLRAIAVGEAFGTIATSFAGHEIEITTFRVKESYTKGSRHPAVVFGQDLSQDLSRRDLTINAMAMDHAGLIIDPFDGQADIERGILRAPGGGLSKTQEIFSDDPLRMLRVARFLARYGFTPDADTTAAASAQHATILTVSHERWHMETLQILRGGRVRQAFDWLLSTGVLGDYMPEVAALAALPSAHAPSAHAPDTSDTLHPPSALTDALATLSLLPPTEPLWRLIGLLSHLDPDPATAADRADAVLSRLRCSNHDRALCAAVLRHLDALSTHAAPSRTDTRRLLIATGPASTPLLAIAEARAAAAGGEYNVRVQHNLATARAHHADLLRDLGGPDLLAPKLPSGLGNLLAAPPLSLPRGPSLRLVMDWLLQQVLHERLPNPPPIPTCLAAAACWRDHPHLDLPSGWTPPPPTATETP